jgi:hypothetical protein
MHDTIPNIRQLALTCLEEELEVVPNGIAFPIVSITPATRMQYQRKSLNPRLRGMMITLTATQDHHLLSYPTTAKSGVGQAGNMILPAYVRKDAERYLVRAKIMGVQENVDHEVDVLLGSSVLTNC